MDHDDGRSASDVGDTVNSAPVQSAAMRGKLWWSDSLVLPVLATIAGVLGIWFDGMAYLTLGFQALDTPERSMGSYYAPTNLDALFLLGLILGTAICLWTAWKLFRRPARRTRAVFFFVLALGGAAVLPGWFAIESLVGTL